jgi:hypothetical protein
VGQVKAVTAARIRAGRAGAALIDRYMRHPQELLIDAVEQERDGRAILEVCGISGTRSAQLAVPAAEHSPRQRVSLPVLGREPSAGVRHEQLPQRRWCSSSSAVGGGSETRS